MKVGLCPTPSPIGFHSKVLSKEALDAGQGSIGPPRPAHMKGCSVSSSCLGYPGPCFLRPLVFWDSRRKESLVLRFSFGDDSWDPDCFPF